MRGIVWDAPLIPQPKLSRSIGEGLNLTAPTLRPRGVWRHQRTQSSAAGGIGCSKVAPGTKLSGPEQSEEASPTETRRQTFAKLPLFTELPRARVLGNPHKHARRYKMWEVCDFSASAPQRTTHQPAYPAPLLAIPIGG